MKMGIDEIIKELHKLENLFLQSSKRFYEADDNNFYVLDLFAIAVNNRAMALTKGFITLVEDKNYVAAVPLIRLQLDNALRFFASTQVKDSTEFVMHFLDGKEIRDYKDYQGKRLTDNYLAKSLDKYFEGTFDLYKKTCGYVHLSDEHFFATIRNVNEKERGFSFVIGSSDNFTTGQKSEFLFAMLDVSRLVIIMVEQWKHEKIRFGRIREENKPSR